jgi:hypothetical protein
MAGKKRKVNQPEAGDRRLRGAARSGSSREVQVAVGKSLAADRCAHARKVGPAGRGDCGDRRRAEPVRAPSSWSKRSLAVALAAIVAGASLYAEPVTVRFAEGLSRGFLILETPEGRHLADGESIQIARGDRVTTHLLLQFLDGSVYEDTGVFSQHGTFRLLRDHTVQRGPSVKQPMDVTIDGATGAVTVRYTENGESKVATERLDLPADTANGFLLTALKNLPSDLESTSFSYVAAGPKPRLVKLEIRKTATEPFWSGTLRRDAIHYVLKVNLKGFAGAVAPLIGKQPPDSHVWVAGGAAPAIVQTEGPLSGDGPVWRLVPSGTRPSFQNPAAKATKAAPGR